MVDELIMFNGHKHRPFPSKNKSLPIGSGCNATVNPSVNPKESGAPSFASLYQFSTVPCTEAHNIPGEPEELPPRCGWDITL